MNLNIHDLQPSDYEKVANMVYSYFQEEQTAKFIIRNWDGIIPSVLHNLKISKDNLMYFGVYDNEELIGFINLLSPLSDKDVPKGEILMTYIHPEFRDLDHSRENYICQWSINKLEELATRESKNNTKEILYDENSFNQYKGNYGNVYRAICVLEV